MQLSKDEFIYLIGIVTITFLVLSVFFVSVLLVNARNRRLKKIELLHAMLGIQENERKRIAEDLHDDIGPILAAIKLRINSMPSLTGKELTGDIKETSNHLDSVIQNIRGIVRNLSPTKMNRLGLIKSIEDFRSLLDRDGKIQFTFIHDGMSRRLKEEAEINIYRIIHEMFNNSLKHSNCNLIHLSLKMDNESLQIIYNDNGKLPAAPTRSDGMGLSNIEHRVNMLGGTFSRCENFTEGANYYFTFQNKNILP